VSEPKRKRPAALVTHSYFDEDPRLTRQAEALVAAGRPVDVFALRREEDPRETVRGDLRVIRLDVGRHQGAGLLVYLWEYLEFLLRVLFALVREHPRRHYAVVSVAAPPDPLVVAALPLRLAGVPVILDLHEATPVFFRTRFPGASNRVTDAILHGAERLSMTLADRVLSVNRKRHERLVGLGAPQDKLRIVANGPSLERFQPDAQPLRAFMDDGTLRLVYTGALTPLYELDLVLRAMALLRDRRPDLVVTWDLYGRGDEVEPLTALATELGLSDRVTFHGRVPLEAIPAGLAGADIGLSPITRNPFTEISLPTKVMEYAAMRRPVVCADLPGARDLFDPEMRSWYEPGDLESLAGAIARLVDDPAMRERAVASAGARSRELSWDREAPGYVALIDGLAAGAQRARSPRDHR
jgi:glycosyltransferase involved in cell wall biosynthesis